MSMELKASSAPAPREGKVSAERPNAEAVADAAEFRRLFEGQANEAQANEAQANEAQANEAQVALKNNFGQGSGFAPGRPESEESRSGSDGLRGNEETPRQPDEDGMSNAGSLAGMSSPFLSGLPHSLFHPASHNVAGPATAETISIPQWAGEIVDKLLVRDSADGTGQEVRLILRQSEFAGAEIRFRQTTEGLDLALISDSPAGIAWLRKAGGELEARLKAKLGTDGVRVTVEESSPDGDAPAIRTRENRG